MFKDRNLSSDLGLVYVNHFTNDVHAITRGAKVAISRNVKKAIRRTGVYKKNRGRFEIE